MEDEDERNRKDDEDKLLDELAAQGMHKNLPWQVLTVCMPILHRYADYLTRIFIDSVFIQNSYTQCFLRDMVERR